MAVFLYIFFLALGGFIGSRKLLKPSGVHLFDRLRAGTLLGLLFLMGINIGLDETVTANFAAIGFQSLVLAIFSIIFSTLALRLVASFVLRKGDLR